MSNREFSENRSGERHELVSMAGRYLDAAALLTRLAKEVQDEAVAYDGDAKDSVQRSAREQLASISAAAITSAFASIEAVVNELFVHAAENSTILLVPPRDLDGNVLPDPRMAKQAVSRLASAWNAEIPEGVSAGVRKANFALMLADRPEFDLARQPAQDAELLRRLRNELIHYQPKFVPVKPAAPTKLEQGLRAKISPNPLSLTLFPDWVLGHSGAEWATTTALKFIDEFFKKLGIHSFLDIRGWTRTTATFGARELPD